MKLNELAPAPGSRKAPKRIGRGIGSGTGKTSGRGHKGQRSRAGSATRSFEGGQMPVYRRLPKRGFKNPFRKVNVPVNLDRLQAAVDAGKIDATQTVDLRVLRKAGLIDARRGGIRLLARGELTSPLTIAVDSASKAAIAAVASAGGRLILGGVEAGPDAADEATAVESQSGDTPVESEAADSQAGA
jgi:large subunit ribosomal protein L15